MLRLLSALFEPKTNAPEVTSLLTKLLNVKISLGTLKSELEEHPNYPSLLSISDVLANYGVENVAAKFEPNQLKNLPTPFITQVFGKDPTVSFFSVVKEVKENSITYLNPETHQLQKSSQEDFFSICSGLVLLTEVSSGAGEKNYKKLDRLDKAKNITSFLAALVLPVIIIALGGMTFLRFGISSLLSISFAIITLLGTFSCALLLMYEIDQHNPLLHRVCSGTKTNCNAVINSKMSKIMGVSWSSIGFVYFCGELLLILFYGLTNLKILFVLSFLNFFTIPYIFFSIYYQLAIVKQWCVLCMAVQSILFLQFVTAFSGRWYLNGTTPIPDSSSWLQFGVAFIIPAIILITLMPALRKSKDSSRIFSELQQLKHTPEVFEALLSKQKILPNDISGLGISLGNSSSTFKIVKVCNPYCIPCANAHEPMEKLLDQNPDLQLQIIFTATSSDGDYKTPPVQHLLAIADTSGEETVKKALDDWYLSESRSYDEFALKYPINTDLANQTANIKKMEDWCTQVQIRSTPTFFLSVRNSRRLNEQALYQLPKNYSVSDLKYFLSI